MALQSEWLIPSQSHMNKDLRVWIPLRKLTTKARKHRDAELSRLRSNLQAAERLELADQMIPIPTSSGTFPAGSDVVALWRERWRQLLSMEGSGPVLTQIPGQSGQGVSSPFSHSTYSSQPTAKSKPAYDDGGLASNTAFDPAYFDASGLQESRNLTGNTQSGLQPATVRETPSEFAMNQNAAYAAAQTNWSSAGPGLGHWLWADTDPSVDVFADIDAGAVDVNMDLDGDIDWYNWVESAKGMESWDAGASGTGNI